MYAWCMRTGIRLVGLYPSWSLMTPLNKTSVGAHNLINAGQQIKCGGQEVGCEMKGCKLNVVGKSSGVK